MLISAAYQSQNQQLHEQREDYGNRSARHAEQVRHLMREYDCATVLDYGCGKGALVKEIPGAYGYDPALQEYSARPDPADLVVCTDVLEHVEPECLTDVLQDLSRCCRKIFYAIIATRPASKTLPDGRNAHLLVEPAEWWLDQLDPYFKFLHWHIGEGTVQLIGEPLRYITDFPVKSAVAEAIRCAQVESACQRGLPRLEVRPAHTRPFILCAYGPSLKHHWQQAVSLPGDLFTCSGSHDFLIERGFHPVGHCECDPRPHKTQFLANPTDTTTYYIASCCHPSMFDQLEGKSLKMWHLHGVNAYEDIVRKYDRGGFMVAGGSTIGLRTLSIGWVLGYRQFHVFGMDCSFEEHDTRHAGVHYGKAPKQILDVRCGGKWYRTSPALIYAARNFINTLNALHEAHPGEFTFDFYGDGLLTQMLRVGTGQISEIKE